MITTTEAPVMPVADPVTDEPDDDLRYTSVDVCRIAGVTFRVLDYWCRLGLLQPVGANGSGSKRRYTAEQVAAAQVLALVSREDRRALTGIADWYCALGAPRTGWLVVGYAQDLTYAATGAELVAAVAGMPRCLVIDLAVVVSPALGVAA